MPARTYLPLLRRHLHVLDIYTAKYGVVIAENLTSAQLTAYEAFTPALADLVAELGPEPISE